MLKNPSPQIHEIETNLFATGTRFEGTVRIENDTRIHGEIEGTLIAHRPSLVILAESGRIKGRIDADRIVIDGCVEGEVQAQTEVIVSPSGKLIGTVHSPSFRLEFGGYFEGSCTMPEKTS